MRRARPAVELVELGLGVRSAGAGESELAVDGRKLFLRHQLAAGTYDVLLVLVGFDLLFGYAHAVTQLVETTRQIGANPAVDFRARIGLILKISRRKGVRQSGRLFRCRGRNGDIDDERAFAAPDPEIAAKLLDDVLRPVAAASGREQPRQDPG
jgi:hypothetical protein